MGAIRPWIFRLLVLIGGALFVYAWFQPWWTAFVQMLDTNAVVIYVHQFVADAGDHPEWLMGAEDEMPAWFFTFMWVYFGAVILALLASLFVSDKKGISLGKFRISLPTAIVTAVGISMVVVCIAAVLTIAMKAGNYYDAPLQGTIFISFAQINESYESWVDTGFQPGFWIACAAGPVLLIAAALRRLIVGKA
jgi:hypothetical protein